MAIYRLPPSPFVGGRQPLAHRDFNPAVGEIPPVVDNPPPRKLGVLAAIFIAWQPLPVVQQPQRFVPEEVRVPFTRHSEIFNNWLTEPAYRQPRIFVPFVEEVAAEQIAFTRHLEVLNNWIYEQLNPQLPKKLVPIEAAPPVVDAPPPKSNQLPTILNNWEERLSFIQIRPFVPITEAAVDTGTPWLRPQLYITLEPYYPTFRRNLQIVEGAAPVVDNPPFGQRIWLKTVLDAWIAPPFNFVKPIQIPIEFIPAPVDDPPFGRRVLWFNTVLDAWIPPPPPPWNPIVHITPPPSGDIIIWMWKRVS